MNKEQNIQVSRRWQKQVLKNDRKLGARGNYIIQQRAPTECLYYANEFNREKTSLESD